jgi:hypothetical protein
MPTPTQITFNTAQSGPSIIINGVIYTAVDSFFKVYENTDATSIYLNSNSQVTNVVLGTSVTTIGGSAFQNCSGLTSITIPNSVTSIGNGAFYNCTGLTSITIPNSVTTIGTGAFSTCSGLTSITIPNSVTTIGGFAFENCSGLTSITIPNSVTTIGDYAFYNCTGLTSINAIDLGNNVTIGSGVFNSCTSLTTVATYSTNLINYITTYYPNKFTITCFKEDSMILTEKGYVKVQELKKGDLVKTMNGEYHRLEMIGTRAVFHYGSEPRIIHQLYKYSKETHSELIEDLIITGFHARLVDEYKNDEEREKARELIQEDVKVDNKFKLPAYVDDSCSVYEETGKHNVYHIVLENEDVRGKYGIYANGMLVESCSKFDMINYAKMTMME